MVHETLENPRQSKLDHDVNVVLGSSDPPPGFGFLHPRFYYLEQKRPAPMEPLRVCMIYIIVILVPNDYSNRDIVNNIEQSIDRKGEIN
jgi:hypothetical protein